MAGGWWVMWWSYPDCDGPPRYPGAITRSNVTEPWDDTVEVPSLNFLRRRLCDEVYRPMVGPRLSEWAGGGGVVA
jgi:hypothetical protein